MNKEIKETLTLIAKRVPPGDQWLLEGETKVPRYSRYFTGMV